MVAVEGPWGRPCSGRGLHRDAPDPVRRAWTTRLRVCLDQAENPRPRPAGRWLVGDAAHTSLLLPPSLHPRLREEVLLRARQTRPGFARRWDAWVVVAKLKWDQTRHGTSSAPSSGLIRCPPPGPQPTSGQPQSPTHVRGPQSVHDCYFTPEYLPSRVDINIFNHIYLEFLKIKRVKHHTELSIKCVLSRALCDITRVLAAPIRCVMCLPHLCDGHFLNLLCAFSIRFRKRLYVHIHAHHEQHATGFRVLFSACKQRSHTLPIAPHLPFHPPLGTGWAQLSLQHLCPVRG